MRPSFDLRTSPWIPVRWVGGSVEQVGLRVALCRADEIRSLECSTPLRQIAMLRLLLALAHRAHRLADIDAAVERLSGKWPAEAFSRYLDEWAGSFDLYDESRPFLQAPWLAHDKKTAEKLNALARITSEWSSGNTKLLMDHHHEAGDYLEPAAEVAQVLVAYQQFCAGGLSRIFKDSAAGGPGMGFAHIWVTAPTLARFLTLNQLPQSAQEYAADLPAWEAPAIGPEDVLVDHPPFSGPASRYCHLSRSILLIPETDGQCRSLHWAEGITRTADDATLDPMEAQRRGKDDAWRSLRLSEERAIWRDSQCLVVSPTGHPPAVVRNATALLEEASDYSPVTIGVGGLLTDKAKLVLWRIEQVTAPIQVLESAELQGALVLALETAEQAGRSLFGAMSELARFLLRESGEADKADTRRVVDGLPGTRHYWHQLDLEFPHFLERLSSPDAVGDALAGWRNSLLVAVENAWRESVRSAGQTRRALLAAAKAEGAYRRTRQAINEKLEVASEGSVTG